MGWLEYAALKKIWQRDDRRAARRGVLPSWHKVPIAAFHSGDAAAQQER